jgi:DNA polymerase III subunit beta
MEFSINAADLNKALQVVQSIVEKKTTMPILTNVLLSANQNLLRISATDLEITAAIEVPAKVAKTGSTTVSAKVFADLVKELPEGTVDIKLGEAQRLEIHAGATDLKIVGVSADEYPALPGLGFEIKARLEAAQLLDMVNRTVHAMSNDETRYNLNGICFELHAGAKKEPASLRLVATDGHRLAIVSRPCGDLQLGNRIIVPRKGVLEIKKILEDTKGEIGVAFEDGFLILQNQTTKVSIRLIDGEFPDYNQVIPKDVGVVAKISAKALTQSLRRVALLVTDKTKCVRFDFSKGHLRLSSASPELGEGTDDLDIEYQGKPLSVGFNAKYLSEFASSIGEEQTIVIELHGELGPGKFSVDGDDSSFGIIMPMRLAA